MQIEGGGGSWSWRYGPRTIKKLMGHFNEAHNMSKGILSLVMILTYFFSFRLYLFISSSPISHFGSIHHNPWFRSHIL
jgi:hypothetical protein